MDTKDMILELRTKMGLSQDELAEKVFVTRQAVSRWENGRAHPDFPKSGTHTIPGRPSGEPAIAGKSPTRAQHNRLPAPQAAG